jgi:hypothetical protein
VHSDRTKGRPNPIPFHRFVRGNSSKPHVSAAPGCD